MRISTTTLESFRLYMEPEQEWMTEADILATIRGDFRTTPQIELGLAFERVLEDPDKHRVLGGYHCEVGQNVYTFDNDTMERPLALIDRRGVFQVKTLKSYDGIDVVSKADQIVGVQINEFKTTTSTLDVEKYLKSYQWRYMLDAFGAKVVTYHVFCLDDHENGVVEVRDIHTFNVFPYPALTQDCRDLLHLFVQFVMVKGLDGLLRRRQETAGLEAFA